MKKLLYLLAFLTLIPLSARADGFKSTTFTSVAADTGIINTNTGIGFHKLTWNVSGTVSACTIALDTSSDNISWSAGGAITGQTCTGNGVSSTVNIIANFVRMNMTAFTGTGSVSVTWNGYVNVPGGGTFGSGAPVGACTNGALYTDTATGNLYACKNLAWVLAGGSGSGGVIYGAGSGAAQTQIMSPNPVVTSLVVGQLYCWSPSVANTGPGTTLQVSAIAAKPILKIPSLLALIGNDIILTVPATIACALWDGTEFQLQNPQAGIGALTSTTNYGPAAQALNLYVSGGCTNGPPPSCTGNFTGFQAPASVAASLQWTLPIVDGTAGDALTSDGSQHLAWSVQRRQTSGTAYTNATTTFSTVVGGSGQTLQFTIAASANYGITCHIMWQGSVNTAGPKFQWTGPASPTAVVAYAHNPITTSTYLDAAATAFSTSMPDTGTITATTNFVSDLTLGLVNGVNAGTVVLQAAANGAGTLTIQPGSFCVSNGDK